MGRGEEVAWVRDKAGSLEKVSHGRRVLRDSSAMVAERDALRMGIERLVELFPTEVSLFDFEVECSGVQQYKLDAQSLQLSVNKKIVSDAHRAGANRL